jgi:hypothetical protein
LHRDLLHDGFNKLSFSLLQFLGGATMKKKVLLFIGLALFALTVVPVINLKTGATPKNPEKEWWRKSTLYNFDFALPLLNRSLYTLGISTNPGQVVIGKNNWLYLGDRHEQTITVTRRGTTIEDSKNAEKIGVATKSWEQWLKARGVRLYLLMFCPNKDTIYPEHTPDWMQSAKDSATNTLLTNVGQQRYVDPRAALLAAKTQYAEPLYFQTDTHWNNFGAWVAFRALVMEANARTKAELRELSEKDVRVSKISNRIGGDLANILRMKEVLRDREVDIEIFNGRAIEIKQYDFESGHLMASTGNFPVDAKQRPIVINSKHALNQKRVLWLRDSFGTATSPYMAATFTETLQADYRKTDPALFARLVDTFRPDYVFITVAERDARTGWFERLPPEGLSQLP